MSSCLSEQQNQDMRQYLRDIRQFPLLSPREEKELAQKCARGDEDAIRQMVNSNLRLVVSIAREYAGRGVPLLDLCQEGSIGLLTAAQKFDHTKNTRFSTYATKWIRQGIGHYIAGHSELIRVPEYTGDQLRRLQKEQTRLQQAGLEPTEEALAQALGIPAEKVRKLQALSPQVCSLETLGEAEELTTTEPQKALLRQELEQILSELLGRLDSRQAQILRLHFGMEDGVCHSLEQIASGMSLSKERVRQLKNQAIEKLHSMGAGFGLEDFLDDLE